MAAAIDWENVWVATLLSTSYGHIQWRRWAPGVIFYLGRAQHNAVPIPLALLRSVVSVWLHQQSGLALHSCSVGFAQLSRLHIPLQELWDRRNGISIRIVCCLYKDQVLTGFSESLLMNGCCLRVSNMTFFPYYETLLFHIYLECLSDISKPAKIKVMLSANETYYKSSKILSLNLIWFQCSSIYWSFFPHQNFHSILAFLLGFLANKSRYHNPNSQICSSFPKEKIKSFTPNNGKSKMHFVRTCISIH